MLLIDSYLQRNGLKRYDVAKRSGISQQVLSNAKNKLALELPMSVVAAIATSVGKTPGAVLDELVELEHEDHTFEALDMERFVIALESQEQYIIIKGPALDEIRPMVEGQVSTLQKDLNEFGWRGGSWFVSAVSFAQNKLSRSDAELHKITEALRNYDILINAREEIILKDRRDQH